MAGARVTALEAVAGRLRCPLCGAGVELRGATVAELRGATLAELRGAALACDEGHRYDVARQGYVSLFPPSGPPQTADTPSMVAAREAFLAAGHYEPIARAVADAAVRAGEASTASERSATAGDRESSRLASPGRPCGGLVADLGAGTGYHLAAVLERLPGCCGLALDASRDAVRRAIRAHPALAGVACDVWRPLPLRDGAADLVLNVFAPRTAAELGRILAPGGAVVVVTPGPRHLEELIAPLGMLAVGEDKQERLREALAPHLEPVGARSVDVQLSLPRDDARALVTMGPSAHHVDAGELERRLAALPDPVTATASVIVETFRRSGEGGGRRQ